MLNTIIVEVASLSLAFSIGCFKFLNAKQLSWLKPKLFIKIFRDRLMDESQVA